MRHRFEFVTALNMLHAGQGQVHQAQREHAAQAGPADLHGGSNHGLEANMQHSMDAAAGNVPVQQKSSQDGSRTALGHDGLPITAPWQAEAQQELMRPQSSNVAPDYQQTEQQEQPQRIFIGSSTHIARNKAGVQAQWLMQAALVLKDPAASTAATEQAGGHEVSCRLLLLEDGRPCLLSKGAKQGLRKGNDPSMHDFLDR